MAMITEKNCEDLKLNRESYIINIDLYRKQVSDYFENIMGSNLLTIKKNINNIDNIYMSDVENIIGDKFLNLPIDGSKKSEIYIDTNFVNSNEILCNEKIIKEMLNSLCYKSGYKMIFGHPYIDSGTLKYEAISEAVTMVYTEDITLERINEESDYEHYFIKNIMRIISTIFDKKIIASQYLGNTNDFEKRFNQVTNNAFDKFIDNLDKVYRLNIKETYRELSGSEMKNLNNAKNELFTMIKKLVILSKEYNKFVYEDVCSELQDSKFLDLVYAPEEKDKSRQKGKQKHNHY